MEQTQTRITPKNITDLEKYQVFVFGSNLLGAHGAGAAKLAYDKGWTKAGKGYGQSFKSGEPLLGSFAIPTKGLYIETLPIEWIKYYVDHFISYTEKFPELTFLVTEIGCGLAGYQPKHIAPLFKKTRYMQNIYLPQRFWDEINALPLPN